MNIKVNVLDLIAVHASTKSSRLRMFFQIGVHKKFLNIHRKTPVLESLFSKVAGLCWRLFLIKLYA